MNKKGPLTKRSGRILAVFLAFVLVFTATVLEAPTAYAADDDPPTESPTQTSQPEEDVQLSPKPQDTAQPEATVPPQISDAPTEDTPTADTTEAPIGESADDPEIIQVDGVDCVSDEVIVKFKDSVSISAAFQTLDNIDSDMQQEKLTENLVVTSVPEGETVESMIHALEEQPNVEYAQPNYVYKLEVTTNDPQIGEQWHLSKIQTFAAWDTTMGSPDVRVAVLDTGIDLDHPEFAGQIYAQTDVVDWDNNADDPNGHGTHVAGIIAAKGNNGIGVVGVAPGVKLIAVDVFYGADAYTSSIIHGINFAKSNGADIINMSFGGYNDDKAFHASIDNAANSGIVCVAAAGNDATSIPAYPSDYSSVISVIATKKNDTKSDYSNYGSSKNISAPGDIIKSTYIGNNYAFAEGTSMAAPIVSGVAALMLSANPNLSVNQIKSLLYETADDLGAPGKDDMFGHGRVNAYKAVSAARSATSQVQISCSKTDVTQYGTPSGSISITASGGSGRYEYSINGGVSWSSSGYFGGLGAGNYTAVARDVLYPANSARRDISIVQPGWVGSYAAKRIPSKANAGTAITIIPPAAPKGYMIQSVSYTSSNPAAATVDGSGNVNFVSGGKATITIKLISQTVDKKGRVKTKTTTIKKTITVKQLVQSISLNATDATIARAQKLKLTASFNPATASSKKVKWTTSNKKVATVSSSGVVTGKGAGTAVITCTAQDGSRVTASCVVTVIPIYPTGIRLSKSSLTLKAGKKATLKATITPKNTDFKTVLWFSSNPEIVSVDSKGRLRALASGTAVIAVTTVSGHIAWCIVTVP